MSTYSNSEYYNMMMCIGACDGVMPAARRLYNERHVAGRPGRRLPSLACFYALANRLHTTGSVHRRSSEGLPASINVETEERILEHFQEDPTRSTRGAGHVFGVNHWAVWRTLHRDRQHPYHYRKTQELSERDHSPRVQFARWYCRRSADEPAFSRRILWTDEASFTRGGLFNCHNQHVWAHDNPHAHRMSSFQHRWRINVWAGILGDQLFGPVFIPPGLNATNYKEFLIAQLEPMLEELPVATYASLIFQHDGAPAHFAREVRAYLSRRYQTWIGRGGTVAWPPRSPDLTPIDFFLWGFIKSQVYAVECTTENEMRDRIISAFEAVTPGMLTRVSGSILRRMHLCIDKAGSHIEPFL